MAGVDALRAQLASLASRIAEIQLTPGPAGAAGPAGAPGASGPTNLFIQQAAPTAAGDWMWMELDGAGVPVTLWVNS